MAMFAPIDVEKMCLAIETGNVQEAEELAEKLAAAKANLSIEAVNIFGTGYKLPFRLEDRCETSDTMFMRVEKTITVDDFKLLIFAKFGFPEELQTVFVKGNMCGNDELLTNCGVDPSRAGEANVHVYLRAARMRDFTEEELRERLDILQDKRILPQETDETSEPDKQLLSNETENTSWECGRCTFINRLLRPSCEICSMNRPDDVIIPENYQPTPEEKKFVEHNTLRRGTGAASNKASTPVKPPTKPQTLPKPATRQPLPVRPPAPQPRKPRWTCPICSFVNFHLLRPSCEICGENKPEGIVVPEGYVPSPQERQWVGGDEALKDFLEAERRQEEEEARRNYEQIVQVEQRNVVRNEEQIECSICFDEIGPGDGMILHNCHHQFCVDCLGGAIRASETPETLCPEQGCDEPILEREVREIVSAEDFDRYQRRGVRQAENQEEKSFHCLTNDCPGWCIVEDDVNIWKCNVCSKPNCLTCKVIHEGMTCKEYQDDLKRRATNDEAAEATENALKAMVESGEAMHCPKCRVIVQKKIGCDWMMCTMCRTEICWATRGPRWGPGGRGDMSGGCRCRVNNKPCVPNCGNCH